MALLQVSHVRCFSFKACLNMYYVLGTVDNGFIDVILISYMYLTYKTTDFLRPGTMLYLLPYPLYFILYIVQSCY